MSRVTIKDLRVQDLKVVVERGPDGWEMAMDHPRLEDSVILGENGVFLFAGALGRVFSELPPHVKEHFSIKEEAPELFEGAVFVGETFPLDVVVVSEIVGKYVEFVFLSNETKTKATISNFLELYEFVSDAKEAAFLADHSLIVGNAYAEHQEAGQ